MQKILYLFLSKLFISINFFNGEFFLTKSSEREKI